MSIAYTAERTMSDDCVFDRAPSAASVASEEHEVPAPVTASAVSPASSLSASVARSLVFGDSPSNEASGDIDGIVPLEKSIVAAEDLHSAVPEAAAGMHAALVSAPFCMTFLLFLL